MARLIFDSGPLDGTALELHAGWNLIGRSRASSVCVDDPSVSGEHCEIIVSDLKVTLRDLGSTNGSYVDGVLVARAELKDGQCLSLGALRLRVVVPEVTIAIPELSRPPERGSGLLADGWPACCFHDTARATHRCVQCAETFCEDCTRQLRLVGGKPRVFCPQCSGVCVAIEHPRPAKRRSPLKRLLDTIRIACRFRSSGPKPNEKASNASHISSSTAGTFR